MTVLNGQVVEARGSRRARRRRHPEHNILSASTARRTGRRAKKRWGQRLVGTAQGKHSDVFWYSAWRLRE